jgi:hypothetical protein
MPRLESWSIVGDNDPYTAPELRAMHLQGLVYDHSGFDDGHTIVTSPILGKANGRVVTKSGSAYELGAVDAVYECQFPSARERLLSGLRGK